MGIAHWVWKQPLKEPVGDLTERFDLYQRFRRTMWWPFDAYLAFRHTDGRFLAVEVMGAACERERGEHDARRAVLEGRADLVDITDDMTEALMGSLDRAQLRANLPAGREAMIARAVATYRNGDGVEVAVVNDMGTDERRQHDEVVEEGSGRKHAQVLAAPLDIYRKRGTILNRQWEAGDKLRSDHYLAGFEPRRVANLNGAPGGGAPDSADRMPDRVVAARQRYKAALDKLGPMGRPIIQHVVLNEEHAGTFTGAGYAGGRQAQIVGMGLLRMALDILSDHYGLSE